MQKKLISSVTLFLVFVAVQVYAPSAMAQGNFTIFGDVRITSDGNTLVPKDVLLLLRRVPDGEVARQMVSSRGRYRFTGLKEGEYEIVAEADGKEIGRLTQIRIGGMTLSNSPYRSEERRVGKEGRSRCSPHHEKKRKRSMRRREYT